MLNITRLLFSVKYKNIEDVKYYEGNQHFSFSEERNESNLNILFTEKNLTSLLEFENPLLVS